MNTCNWNPIGILRILCACYSHKLHTQKNAHQIIYIHIESFIMCNEVGFVWNNKPDYKSDWTAIDWLDWYTADYMYNFPHGFLYNTVLVVQITVAMHHAYLNNVRPLPQSPLNYAKLPHKSSFCSMWIYDIIIHDPMLMRRYLQVVSNFCSRDRKITTALSPSH